LRGSKSVVSTFHFTKPLPKRRVLFQAFPGWENSAHFPSAKANGKKVWYKWRTGARGPSVDLDIPNDTHNIEIVWELRGKATENTIKSYTEKNYNDIEQVLVELNDAKWRLGAIQNSTSWKLTAPMRGVMDLIRFLLGKR
jgi:hypothetical protein